jgi:Lrp/AsnC family leucine-responsive transcriptional regulator
MTGAGLDHFDERLLALLQVQADLTQAQLAERVHLSPTQCARRVARLKQEGYILGFSAMVDHKKLGLSILSHTQVSVLAHHESANAAFRAFVQSSPEVVECYTQTGDADYIMKILCRDLDDLSNFLERMVKAAGGVASVRSSVALQQIKRTPRLQR